jgi:hypothetical protein
MTGATCEISGIFDIQASQPDQPCSLASVEVVEINRFVSSQD